MEELDALKYLLTLIGDPKVRITNMEVNHDHREVPGPVDNAIYREPTGRLAVTLIVDRLL